MRVCVHECVQDKTNVFGKKYSRNLIAYRWGIREQGNKENFWHKKNILYINRVVHHMDELSFVWTIKFKYRNKTDKLVAHSVAH